MPQIGLILLIYDNHYFTMVEENSEIRPFETLVVKKLPWPSPLWPQPTPPSYKRTVPNSPNVNQDSSILFNINQGNSIVRGGAGNAGRVKFMLVFP